MVYFLLSLLSFAIATILTPILINFGIKRHLCDIPAGDELKIHKKPIPYLGGLAMLAGVICALVVALFFTKGLIFKLAIIAGGAIIISFFGFYDDIKWKHITQAKPKIKVSLQLILIILITAIFMLAGIKINLFPNLFLAGPLTFCYILILVNGVNLQDGLDGLAGGLVAISAIGFGILSWQTGNGLGLTISLATLGACLGFLIYNWHPASIFMGDSGSYFLGLMLAVLAIIFTSKSYDFRWFIGPLLIVGMPIFDTGFAIIRRLARGKSPFLGDRSHIYDRINLKGISIKNTVLLCYLIQIILIISGLLMLK